MPFFTRYQTFEWELFIGNALMLLTALLYLAWWRLAFWPGTGPKPGFSSLLVAGAMLSGVLSLVATGLGIASAPPGGRGIPIVAIVVGAVAAYILLSAVTTMAFRRALTAELLVMVVWAAVELLAANALFASGRFSATAFVACVAAVGLASVAGMACYLLYYRLDPGASFWDGLIPLAADALVTAGILFGQAAAKAG